MKSSEGSTPLDWQALALLWGTEGWPFNLRPQSHQAGDFRASALPALQHCFQIPSWVKSEEAKGEVNAGDWTEAVKHQAEKQTPGGGEAGGKRQLFRR